jgi:hypothetical protein
MQIDKSKYELKCVFRYENLIFKCSLNDDNRLIEILFEL